MRDLPPATATLAQKFAALRKKHGFTYDQLGAMTKSSKPYLWGIQNGIHTKPSAKKLSVISKAFDVDIDYLLG